jgi:hypothetical protein
MAVILSPLGLYEGNRKVKLPYYIKLRYMPLKGLLGIFIVQPSDGCPVTTNLLSLNASLEIPMCVLRFEASGRGRRTQVRSVYPTGPTS